ncbi:hypothetical protein XB02_14330 [Pantoea ananatis]|nr:hypothetical protein XB02_14330 [Pantoea ananatis]
MNASTSINIGLLLFPAKTPGDARSGGQWVITDWRKRWLSIVRQQTLSLPQPESHQSSDPHVVDFPPAHRFVTHGHR